MREWFVNILADGAEGQCRPGGLLLPPRCESLLTAQGNLGLIATNTVGPRRHTRGGTGPDGRRWLHNHPVDSEPLLARGQRQPGVSPRCGAPRTGADQVPRVSQTISSSKRIRRCSSRPAASRCSSPACRERRNCLSRLHRARHGIRARPAKRQGTGSSQIRRNREVLFPYLNGEDLNSRPDCSRLPLGHRLQRSDQKSRPLGITMPFERVERRVRPERS